MRATPVAREALRALGVLAAGAVLGFVLLVVGFKLGLAATVGILFYRGVLLCLLAALLTTLVLGTLGARTGRACVAEAIAAGALSLGLNLAFLVIVPVTIDRSVSVFVLGEFARADLPLSRADVERRFLDVYVGELAAIPRRLDEQERSGNLARIAPDAYVLTPRGRRFLDLSRSVGRLFDVDPRLLDPPSTRGRETARP